MAWFRNHYECERCGCSWADEWSCMCDDECPSCGLSDMTPYDSDDLTEIVEPSAGGFVVLRSPDEADHDPDYREAAIFPSQKQAEEYLRRAGAATST